jgi:hypothetical protein
MLLANKIFARQNTQKGSAKKLVEKVKFFETDAEKKKVVVIKIDTKLNF